ncbi:MAG: helix-turn-helix transcriptional regulator [Rikenellaceae bacterium]|nr:helix-turn-helix transcriptional regulator [Rikenellaceae bacterium]
MNKIATFASSEREPIFGLLFCKQIIPDEIMLLHNEVVSFGVVPNEEVFFTIGVVYEGTKRVYCRGKQYCFASGDLFCVGRECCRVENIPSKHYPYKEVVITFSFEELQQLTPWFNDLIADNRLRQSAHDIGPVAGCEADAAVLGIFNALRQSPLPPSFTKRQGILKMLSDYTDGMVLRVALSNLDSRNLLLNNVVRNNRFRHATIDDLAEQCHCSRSSFKELFHKHYDTSPYHYFLEQRLEKAQSLLTGSSCSISEISEICEFNSPSHFARIFRSYFACSPSEYRRQQQLKKWL